MKNYQWYVGLTLLVVMTLCLVSCEKNKQGKVAITEQEFVLRQDSDHSYVVDAKGKIKNVGEADVKRVVVTGYCRSCSEIWVVGQWLGTEKTADQKDMINYIPVGAESEFFVKEIAGIYYKGEDAPELPEKLEVVVESFETVQ